MKLRIFSANSREELKDGKILESTTTVKNLDVQKVGKRYYEEKPRLQKPFDEFVGRWETEYSRLLLPQAGIVHWSKEELLKEYIPKFPVANTRRQLEEHCTSGYAMLWSIGEILENEAFEMVQNSTLQAMFLDVACTLYMGEIRKKLIEHITKISCSGKEVLPLAEHSPEIRDNSTENNTLDPRLKHVVEPWISVSAEFRPQITMNRHGVMVPLKSQCSMLFIGESNSNEQIKFDAIPCSNCLKNRCLYSQLGGCHMPEEYQYWLKEG